KPALFCCFQLISGKALGQDLLNFFPKSCLQAVDILGSINGIGEKRTAFVKRTCAKARSNAVANALFLSNAGGKPRVQKAASQHKVAKRKCRIIGIVVTHFDIEPSNEKGVCLVWRFERFQSSRQIEIFLRDSRERFWTFPIAE